MISRRMLQNFIGRGRSTCSSTFFKESKILWTIAASHRPPHFRTAQEIPFRSGSSTNERVRSRSDPGGLGMVNTVVSVEYCRAELTINQGLLNLSLIGHNCMDAVSIFIFPTCTH